MKSMKLSIPCAVLLLGAVSVSLAAGMDPLSKVNRLPPSLEQKAQDLRADLEHKGYEVARGYWALWSEDDCKYPIRTLGNCYGNNPSAPYALAFLPHWKDEFADQSLHHALTEARRGMSANYRLGEREALVVLAELPPAARYFGIQTNVFTRETSLNPADPIYQSVSDPLLRGILFGTSPNPSRMMMVASIGNSTNNVVIQGQSEAVWGQQRFFVITSDAGMADAMTEALEKAGVDKDHVFTEPVSRDLVRLGYDPAADDLITYIRYALPDDPEQGDQWRKQLPLTVLRVRGEGGPLDPFPIPEYMNKEGNVNYDETQLEGDLKAIRDAVRQYWNPSCNPAEEQTCPPAVSLFSATRVLDLLGQHCLGHPDKDRGPMNCVGDSQDADYQLSQSLHIDNGEVIAVVGTLGTETGNATYTSLSVNRFPLLMGVESIDDDKLKGSAVQFTGVVPDPSKFYVYYLARDCSGLSPWCFEIPRQLVPQGETIKVIQRNYVNPGSTVGPDPTKVLNPVTIVLDGRHRPTVPPVTSRASR